MQRATVNSTDLDYDLLGDGPELVWLHGLGGDLEQTVPGGLLAGLLVTVLSAGAQTYLQLTVPRTHTGRVPGVMASAFGLASMACTALLAVLIRTVRTIRFTTATLKL